MAAEPPVTITTEAPAGATYHTDYVGRRVTVFAVADHELEMLSHFNTLATTFFSIGSFFASFALAIWVSASFSTQATAEGAAMMKFGTPTSGILAVISYAIGIWAAIRKTSMLRTIRQQSSARPEG